MKGLLGDPGSVQPSDHRRVARLLGGGFGFADSCALGHGSATSWLSQYLAAVCELEMTSNLGRSARSREWKVHGMQQKAGHCTAASFALCHVRVTPKPRLTNVQVRNRSVLVCRKSVQVAFFRVKSLRSKYTANGCCGMLYSVPSNARQTFMPRLAKDISLNRLTLQAVAWTFAMELCN